MKHISNIFRYALISAFAFLASVTCHAQLLWQVTGADTKHPSYIFGTYHLATADMLDSVAGFDEAFNSVDIVVTEVDSKELSNPFVQQRVAMRAFAKPDSTVVALATPQQLEAIKSFFNKYDTSGNAQILIQSCKPIMSAMYLSALLPAVADIPTATTPDQILDVAIGARAAAAGKKVRALEDADFQAKILFGLPITEQMEMLVDLVSDPDGAQRDFLDLYHAYHQQDFTRLSQIIDQQMSSSFSLSSDALLNNRNSDWVQTLTQQLLPNHSVLIAVGAGHLPGDVGLISLLRECGYTVEPYPNH